MQTARKLIIGNWKMHGDAGMAQALTDACAAAAAAGSAQVVLCPPATLLHVVARAMIGSALHLGGQDCSAHAEGAHTGDISAAMLAKAGCSYVIVGHSERRHGHGETSETVREKAARAQEAGLTPVICVGETFEERKAGRALAVVEAQIAASLPAGGHFVLAYEPVWAIGSGQTPSAGDIGDMHRFIASRLAAPAMVLYGGSVKAANAAEILTIPGVSGVLVGGASLKAEEFGAIVKSTQSLESRV